MSDLPPVSTSSAQPAPVDSLIAAFMKLGLVSEEIADTIWLALEIQQYESPYSPGENAVSQPDKLAPEAIDSVKPIDSFKPIDPFKPIDRFEGIDSATNLNTSTASSSDSPKQAEIIPAGEQTSGDRNLAIRLPDARSLPEPLALARALRPLFLRVPSANLVLDEAATIDRIAEEQLWTAVLRPDLEPWLELALVVDESPSMLLWQRTIRELQDLLEGYGIFRDVRTWGMIIEPVVDRNGITEQQVRLRPGIGKVAHNRQTRSPRELLDPQGRRLIMIATDCVAAHWHDGTMLSTLKTWSQSSSTAIIQMLPEWLWSRTALGRAAPVRFRALLPGLSSNCLQAKPLSSWDEIDFENGIKVPIVTLEPEIFTTWSQLVAGKGGVWAPGFVFEPEFFDDEEDSTDDDLSVKQGVEEDSTDDDLSAEQQVSEFYHSASPMAWRLISLLAAAPVICLPVVRIIQRELLPKSRQVHVAEVFLGGLIGPCQPLSEITPDTDPNTIHYDFGKGVRTALLESSLRSDSVNVFEVVSQFVDSRIGRSVANFVAYLRDPDRVKNGEIQSSIATITAEILKQLGGEYTRYAEQLEGREESLTVDGAAILSEAIEQEESPTVDGAAIPSEAIEQEEASTVDGAAIPSEAIEQEEASTVDGNGIILDEYRKSLISSYGSLKLHTLDSTDRQYQIKLWQIFIEQNVRESLPPSRFEIPQDYQQQLLKSGQLDLDLNSEQVEQYRRQYLEKSVEPVLKAIGDEKCQRAVVVGDPGSGKSTLLQYLALDWAEGNGEENRARLPLLIELREYVNDRSQSKTFLDFLERGARADWKFDRYQLNKYLRTQPSLVMFDGLDEVFDRYDYEAVVDEIANFATQQYPNAKIIVTSRVIGYKAERLQGVNFQHFTLQNLDRAQIDKFIEKWYEFVMGEDPEKERLKQRLKEAIDNSPAIQNLADNPLLLTMMAILNRRESLPRNRVELYDQASRVLLHNWDVNHKKLGLSLDRIGQQEKQAMLRMIAYEMQSGEKGLAGNLIDAGRLKTILTSYLKREGFKDPRETAERLIAQLRSRNYILCDRGADTYGFVYRTFLEYFCATEIVRQFQIERSLSPEQLRDNIFGQHWQDKTWHEVLRLICGLLEPKFAGQLIEFLMEREVDRADYLDNNRLDWEDEKNRKYAVKEAFLHLQLATECFAEIRNPQSIDVTATKLKEKLKNEIESHSGILLNYQSTKLILYSIAEHYHHEPELLTWLQKIALTGNQYARSRAVSAIAKYYHQVPNLLTWLKNIDLNDTDKWVRRAAVKSIGEYYHTESKILNWLQDRALNDREARVRSVAVESCAKYYIQADGVFELLCQVASQDPYRGSSNFWNPRQTAVQALVKHYIHRPEVIELLHNRSTRDSDERLRKWAEKQLEKIG